MSNSREVSGTISLHPRGFGFLNFAGAEGPESAFIAPPDLNGFLLDDVVSCQVTTGSDGRHSASKPTLVKRRRSRLLGQVIERKGQLYLATDREVSNTDWPLQGSSPVGEHWLCKVDGDQAAPLFAVPQEQLPLARLMARFDLVEEFTAEAIAQTRTIVAKPQELGHRKDLRHLQTVTIDAPSTRDKP